MESEQKKRNDGKAKGIKKSKYVWMDGKIVQWDRAKISIAAHALHYGTGVFEGIRGYESNGNLLIFRMRDHFERLLSSAKICDIEIQYTADELCQACVDLARANKIKEDCYIRPILFVGFSGIDLSFMKYPSNSAIIAFPFKNYFSKSGLDACVSSWMRICDPVTPPMAKICGNYINSVFAKREAVKNGYDEAIMLNAEGKVAEGSGENIFIVRKGKITTPSLGSSILDGITRNTIIHIAGDLGMEVQERSVARSELYTADEVFLTGTAAGIIPVLSVDRKTTGNGKTGPITKRLSDAYSDAAHGKSSTGDKNWITCVYGKE